MGNDVDFPDAPDYSELSSALKESSKYSYDLAREQFDWAKQAYAENKATGGQVIDFVMGQMDKQAAWADADRKRYEDIYQPLEDKAAQRAYEFNTAERREAEAGKAQADVAAEFKGARDAARQRLEAFGVDPSSTRQGALDLGTRIAEAAAQASAGNQARWQTEAYGDQLLAGAINTGKGYPAQALAASGAANASGNQAANTSLATTASGANTMGTGYQWQGMGNQAVGQWGQMLNAGFQNQLSSAQAQNDASGSGWGGLIGNIAGTFLGGPGGAALGGAAGRALGWAEGGAIPDPDGMSVPPGASPSGGAIPDDVPAEIEGGTPARLNAGEFVMPKDIVAWLGEKGMQQIILKARKEMGDPNQAPAQPSSTPPDQQQPPVPPRGVGAIPDQMGAV